MAQSIAAIHAYPNRGTEPNVKQLRLARRTPPNPYAPGTLVVAAGGESTTHTVQPGQRIVIGRDPGASIVLDDPQVSLGHVSIERRGPGWLVRSLDLANPAWILDATGRAQPIETELGLRSGELVMGSYQVLLYPPAP